MSHVICLPFPKPSFLQIQEMLIAYYEEQAHEYDLFDLENHKRYSYLNCINNLIINDLINYKNIENLLEIGCGTGRRASEIRKLSGLNYKITGVDTSSQMCALSKQRGIENIINCDWREAKLLNETQFDIATFLYSFGHVATSFERLKSIEKISTYLKPYSPLYLDVFNINDLNEWGPEIKENFYQNDLKSFGYDLGDVFYKKIDSLNQCFIHYFSEEEICDLLIKGGFEIERISYIGYGKYSGDMMRDSNQGKLFIKAINKKI